MSLVALLFYLTAGLMFAVFIQSIALAVLNVQRKLLTVFAFACLFAGAYQLFLGFYYQVDTLAGSVIALRLQTAAAILALFFIVWFIGIYVEYRYMNQVLALVAFWACAVLILNAVMPGTLRFEENIRVSELRLPWGEPIYPIVGEQSAVGALFHLGAQALFLWLVYQCLNLAYRKDYLKASFLFVYIVIQLYTAILSGLIDSGEIEFFYLAGFTSVIVMMLMALSLAIDARNQHNELAVTQDDLDESLGRTTELTYKHQILLQMFQQLPFAVHIVDEQQRIIWLNKARDFLKPFKFKQGDCLSDSNLASRVGVIDAVERAFKGHSIELPEINISESTQDEMWIKQRFFPLRSNFKDIDHVAILSEEYNQKYIVKHAISQIAAGVSPSSEYEFFEGVVRHLVAIFDAKVAYVAEAVPRDNPLIVRTLVASIEGEIVSNFIFDLKGSPCEVAIDKQVHLYACDLQRLFPDDLLLQEMQLESFIGMPMLDDSGLSYGLVVVMDNKPMVDIKDKQAALEIFAARAGAELQRLAAEKEVHRLAYKDYITHLPNRAQLHIELNSIFERLDLSRNPVYVFLLDLDYFHNINNSLGHEVGDAALLALAERYRQRLPNSMFIARFGGDEFIFVEYAQEAKISDLQISAEALIALTLEPLYIGEHEFTLAASVGCAYLPDHASSELEVLRAVELALHKAKQEGRNRYEIFNPIQLKASDERNAIRSELVAAIANNELELFVQPKVDAQGRILGGEALVRWRHPVRGFMSPAEFIPIAEESGLIYDLGEWVINTACLYVSRWIEQGCMFGRLAINISAWQIASPEFEGLLDAALAKHGIGANKLILEVTESALLRDVHSTISIFDRLRKKGFKISLDDFGTGYSSLAYLRDLPLDELKIDKSFVAALHDTRSQALVRSMIAIANNLGLTTVAEGVEKERQKETVITLGCDVLQGFLFSGPMSEQAFIEWAKKNS